MSYDNPNFTIITPGGCNSFCSFCTDPMKRKPSAEYMANLVDVLSNRLPDHFRQVSISGGEPTLSPVLPAILDLVRLSRRFNKVVLTTNGARLPELVPLLQRSIHHLNVSRHAIGYEANTKVFGTRNIVTDEQLKAVAFELNKAGIDVNLNHVYTKGSALTVDYVMRFVDYARSVGATSVSFRYDQNENSLEPTYLEKLFSDWVAVNQGGCPVCRNHTVLVGGFPVVFKASFAEPSKAIADVYELVYHITGKLTTDWEGANEFTPAQAHAYQAAYQANSHKQHPVVAHTVAAPNSPPKGRRMAPTVRRAVVAKSAAPAVAPVTVVRVAPEDGMPWGGGCGGAVYDQGPSMLAPLGTGQAPAPAADKPSRIQATVASDDWTQGLGGGCGSGIPSR